MRRQPPLGLEPLQESGKLVSTHAYSLPLLITNSDGQDFAQAREEVDSLARVEVVGIAAADDQEADPRLRTERHERRRAHDLGVAIEDVLLPIAQRTAARLGGAQERGERP